MSYKNITREKIGINRVVFDHHLLISLKKGPRGLKAYMPKDIFISVLTNVKNGYSLKEHEYINKMIDYVYTINNATVVICLPNNMEKITKEGYYTFYGLSILEEEMTTVREICSIKTTANNTKLLKNKANQGDIIPKKYETIKILSNFIFIIDGLREVDMNELDKNDSTFRYSKKSKKLSDIESEHKYILGSIDRTPKGEKILNLI